MNYPHITWKDAHALVAHSKNHYSLWSITKRFKNGVIIAELGYRHKVRGKLEDISKQMSELK